MKNRIILILFGFLALSAVTIGQSSAPVENRIEVSYEIASGEMQENNLGKSGKSDICGDWNGDGEVNLFDVVHFIQCIYYQLWECEFYPWIWDVNNDGTVSIFDATYLISYLYLEGPDLNCPPPE